MKKALSRVGQAAAEALRGVVDRLERSQASVEFAVEELDQHVRDARRGLIQSVAAQRQLADKADRAGEAAEIWTRRAELAVRAGDEPLAREALGQKQRHLQSRRALEQALEEQRQVSQSMKRDLERMGTRLEALKLRAPSLAATAAFHASGGRAEALGTAPGEPSAVEAFSQIEERLDGVDAVFEAQKEVDELLSEGGGGSDASLEAKFVALEGSRSRAGVALEDPAVEKELVDLKKRFRV